MARAFQRWLVISAIGVCGIVLLWFVSFRSKLTYENYEKIDRGMSREQVEKILGKGKLTKDSTKDPKVVTEVSNLIPKESEGQTIRAYSWKNGDHSAEIYFAGDNPERVIFSFGWFP